MFAEMIRQEISLSELSRRVGCDYHTIASWRCQCNPQLQLLDAAITALGFDLMPVPKGAKK
jgi:transposase-like protein